LFLAGIGSKMDLTNPRRQRNRAAANKNINSMEKKVLIIEDEPLQLELLRDKIKALGFSVIEARDGEGGLDMAKKNHPDLILLDLILPRMDGVTLLNKLREDEWGRAASVVILTNLCSAEAVQKSEQQGVHDYLVKADYTLDDLMAIVKKKLE